MKRLDLIVGDLAKRFIEANNLADGGVKVWMVELAREQAGLELALLLRESYNGDSVALYTIKQEVRRVIRSSVENAIRSDEPTYQMALTIRAFEQLDEMIKADKLER